MRQAAPASHLQLAARPNEQQVFNYICAQASVHLLLASTGRTGRGPNDDELSRLTGTSNLHVAARPYAQVIVVSMHTGCLLAARSLIGKHKHRRRYLPAPPICDQDDGKEAATGTKVVSWKPNSMGIRPSGTPPPGASRITCAAERRSRASPVLARARPAGRGVAPNFRPSGPPSCQLARVRTAPEWRRARACYLVATRRANYVPPVGRWLARALPDSFDPRWLFGNRPPA